MQKPKISLIVAMDEKRGIGKNNELMWHIPGELPRFKRITVPHPIIMGRKTFDSIGRVLPNRPNIIISRDTNYHIDGAIVVHSLQQAIEKGSELEINRVIARNEAISSHNDSDSGQARMISTEDQTKALEVFIIGGGQIFTEALPLADKLYLTLVKGDFGADTFFPPYDEFTKVISKEDHDDGTYKYSFLEIEK